MRWLIVGALLLVTPPLAAQGEGERISEAWRGDVARLDSEINRHKMRYGSAMERSDRFKEQASWIHFRDHARYRNLMGRSQREQEYASESRKEAERLMKQRDDILTGQGLPKGDSRTPW
jgi:hypothetical protein